MAEHPPPEPEPRPDRRGITFFGPPAEAPLLHETEVMSMPEMDPPAPEQMMTWALSGSHVVKVLFSQPDGMSLVWSWFGPGYPLPRHSHSADCLYYVVAGEARMGNRTIEAGAGFFVPADAPYAYTAGPEGIQILEFRNVDRFDMQITEGLDRWDRIVDIVEEQRDTWQDAATGV
jgi:hypothetical protein